MLSGKTCAERTVLPPQARRIASWNSGRDCWETDQIDLLSGRSVVFSETFPISGMTVNGVAYELPMSGHLTAGSEYSSSLNGELFPTPTVSKRPNRSASPGAKLRPSIHQITDLLPTPNTMEHLPARTGEARERQLRRGDPEGSRRESMGNLREDIAEIPEGQWGKYEPAIRRWETVLGRPAPEPTEQAPKGGRRLSARFVEWMQGLPDGWVTDPVLGLSRVQQLKMLGNGVVTAQAVEALERMRRDA